MTRGCAAAPQPAPARGVRAISQPSCGHNVRHAATGARDAANCAQLPHCGLKVPNYGEFRGHRAVFVVPHGRPIETRWHWYPLLVRWRAGEDGFLSKRSQALPRRAGSAGVGPVRRITLEHRTSGTPRTRAHTSHDISSVTIHEHRCSCFRGYSQAPEMRRLPDQASPLRTSRRTEERALVWRLREAARGLGGHRYAQPSATVQLGLGLHRQPVAPVALIKATQRLLQGARSAKSAKPSARASVCPPTASRAGALAAQRSTTGLVFVPRTSSAQ